MKKYLSIIIAIVFVLSTSNLSQASEDNLINRGNTTIEYLDNGDYIETTIVILNSTRGYITGTKTSTYKNSSNESLWDVSVTGTFSYSGTSCTCVNATGDSNSYSSYWTVSYPTISRSGNTATSSATGKKYLFGVLVQTQILSVTLSCSNNGVLS
jgi:hypothetical protein